MTDDAKVPEWLEPVSERSSHAPGQQLYRPKGIDLYDLVEHYDGGAQGFGWESLSFPEWLAWREKVAAALGLTAPEKEFSWQPAMVGQDGAAFIDMGSPAYAAALNEAIAAELRRLAAAIRAKTEDMHPHHPADMLDARADELDPPG